MTISKRSTFFIYSCNMNFWVLVILLICSLNHLTGQELYGKYLGTEHGLLSNECYDINYSKEGYLIVGTQYGPMKYDGEKFIPICLNLPIERRIMYDFEKDPKGCIYMFNSKNELFTLKGDRAVKLEIHYSKTIQPHIRFRKLQWFKKGLIVFTNYFYFKFSFKEHSLIPFSKTTQAFKNTFIYDASKEFPFDKKISRHSMISDHSIVFKSLHKKLHIKEGVNSDSREDVIQIGENRFILISSQLYRINGTQIEKLPFKQILFIESFHHRLWLCTTDGLIELDKNGKWLQTHFKGRVIGGVVPLRQHGIAVSLNQHGVFISSDINERSYSRIQPTHVTNHHQTTIVGNQSGQLFHFSPNQLTKLHESIDLNENISPTNKKIRQIEFINGKWYVCTIKGIYTLDSDLKKREKLMFSDFYTFNDFFLSKGYINCLGWSYIKSFQPIEREKVIPLLRCKYQVNDTLILIGTEEGLFEYHASTGKLIRSRMFQKAYYISHIQALSPGEFLITSRYKGIFHFKDGQLIKKYVSPSISVKKTIVSHHQIFVCGNQGIYTKPLKNHGKSSWRKIFDKEIENIFLIRDNLFICASEDLIIKKISSKYESLKPALILNEILLGDERQKEIPKKIDYNIPISFDFDILHFDADKLQLYYQLNGEVKIYKQTEGTRLNFEALPSGNYHLELFPVIDGKILFSHSKQYSFTINEPFWESTLFYLFISIVIFLALFSFRLIRNLRRKKRMAERAELESKLNEYKLLAVKAQVNPHFLSNGLSAIQALILKEDNDLAAQYLAKFSFLMRKILYYSDTQFISLKQELELIDAYLELELLRFRNRFVIRREIQLSESQLNEFRFPSLLLQPILENAIWHGLKFQENNPELRITISLNGNHELVIQISDNGYGFNSSNQSEVHLSKGNQLIHERVGTLNQQFQTTAASVEITSSSSGTTVTFIFSPQIYLSAKP